MTGLYNVRNYVRFGVLPRDRNPNLPSFSGGLSTHQAWRLMPAAWTGGEDRSVGWIRASGRLNPSVTLSQAQAEVDALFEQVNARVGDRDGGSDLRVNVVPVREDLVGGVARTLWGLAALPKESRGTRVQRHR